MKFMNCKYEVKEMTNNVIIDYTKCKYNTFDGGGSQRTICSLDGKYCDCLRDKDCYYKQLQAKTAENRNLVNWLNRIIYCFTFSARIPSNLIADLKKYLAEIGKLEV